MCVYYGSTYYKAGKSFDIQAATPSSVYGETDSTVRGILPKCLSVWIFLDDMCCLLVLDSVTSTKQWRQPRPRVYLKEGTYHTRLFRGTSTNDMKNMMMMSFICSCRNKNQPKATYPKGTSHHTRMFRGPSTNGMKK